jgi:hypothetical protein
MASQPPAKKQKVSRPTVVFKSPGLPTPDVRFRVFDDYEFHVHSVVLKMNSAFFQRFLDLANKDIIGEKCLSGFQYEWVSEIDDSGMDLDLAFATEVKA